MSISKLTEEEQKKLLKVVFNVDGASDKLRKEAAQRLAQIAEEKKLPSTQEDLDQ